MVVFVTNGQSFQHAKELVRDLCKRFPAIQSIIQNINTQKANTILGKRNVLLFGKEEIHDTIGDLKFAISAHSFYQVNSEQTKVLYDCVLQAAQLTGEEVVLDIYCGIGTISLYLARHCKRVIGVEIVEPAIHDANKNAHLNGLSNTQFICGDAAKILTNWQDEKPSVVVLDPPRKGCERGVLHSIENMEVKKIIYVSCNPATLARDARILCDMGYKLQEVQPVDMFPQTDHVECVALFTR